MYFVQGGVKYKRYASNYTGSIFEDERAAGESETSSIIETLCNLNFDNIE